MVIIKGGFTGEVLNMYIKFYTFVVYNFFHRILILTCIDSELYF